MQGIVGAYASREAGATLLASVRDGRLAIAPADRPSRVDLAEPLDRDAFVLDGNLLHILRDPQGRAIALRFTSGRVYSLAFGRVSAP